MAPPPIPGINRVIRPVIIEAKCIQCKKITNIQASFIKGQKIEPNATKFPKNNMWTCKHCKHTSNVLQLRQQIESQMKMKIID